MPTFEFEPEPHVTESVWLDVAAGDPWVVWRSMPEGGGPNRKRMLLVAYLLRQVAGQFSDPVYLNAVEAGEQFADGVISEEEMVEARRRAYEAFNATEQPSAAAHRAAACARNYLYEVNETAEMVVWAAGVRGAHLAEGEEAEAARKASERAMAALCRRLINEVFGTPFRPVAFSPAWRSNTAVTLASQMYATRDFSGMPVLADALEEAGCTSAEALDEMFP